MPTNNDPIKKEKPMESSYEHKHTGDDEIRSKLINPTAYLGINYTSGYVNKSGFNDPEKLMKTIILAKDGDYHHQVLLATHFHEKSHREFARYWFAKSLPETRSRANGEVAEAEFLYALFLHSSDFLGISDLIAVDKKKAGTYFRKAAKKGDVKAQFYLARMLHTGDGIEKNIEEAVDWFHKAAELGLASAQNYLAVMFINGDEIDKNMQKAADYFHKAAEQGDPDAQYNLALMLQTNNGGDKNFKQAAYWYRKAAEQGHAIAPFKLAVMLQVDGKKELAAYWYRKAAEQGDASVKNILATKLRTGDGIDQNIHEAAYWYRKAAELGDAGGMYNLALCFEFGIGVKQSHFNELLLIFIAMKVDSAPTDLAKLLAERIDEAKIILTPELFESVEGYAKEWKVGSPLPLDE